MQFSAVFLMLGEKCNLSCRYCLQHDRITEQLPDSLDSRVIDYLNSLEPYTGPNRKGNFAAGKISLRFYGGEPLLYFDTIQRVTAAIDQDKYNLSMISNGELLTQAMVDFINENAISFAVSHDGPCTDLTRGVNVFERDKFVRLFQQIQRKGISHVVTPKTYTIYDSWQYYYEKLGEYPYVNFDWVMDTGTLPADLQDFNSAGLEQYYTDLYQYLLNRIKTDTINTSELAYITQITNSIDYYTNGNYQPGNTKCRTVEKMLNIDTAGNAYLCHNCSTILGNVLTDPYSAILERYQPYNKYAISEKCQTCPAFPVCLGGCILVSEEARERYYCQMFQTLQKPVNWFISEIIKLHQQKVG